MELSVLLSNYEKLIKSASGAYQEEIRKSMERNAWNVYRFLVSCGVDREELNKIENKYYY